VVVIELNSSAEARAEILSGIAHGGRVHKELIAGAISDVDTLLELVRELTSELRPSYADNEWVGAVQDAGAGSIIIINVGADTKMYPPVGSGCIIKVSRCSCSYHRAIELLKDQGVTGR
jgi:hypothetical protein